jgi:hypothetical protein
MRSEYFVSFKTSVVITEDYNVMVNLEELIGTTEYPTLKARCSTNRCGYDRVRLRSILTWLYGNELLEKETSHCIGWDLCENVSTSLT